MISIIITSKNEPGTIARAIQAFLSQDYNGHDFEIIVAAPDQDTLSRAEQLKSIHVKTIQDQGQGKPAALNLCLSKAQGNILIFSDGDVEAGKGAVKELLSGLPAAATGRPIPVAQSRAKYNFWANCLFNTAHDLRLKRSQSKLFVLLSGYLMAVRKENLTNFKFPENMLTEDEYLSYYLYHRGFFINYTPQAKVKVKFPDNYCDFIKQKTRTLGGTYQIPSKWKQGIAMRSFSRESGYGFSLFRQYGRSFKQRYWLILLFLARLHAWARAFLLIKIFKKNSQELWIRADSTK